MDYKLIKKFPGSPELGFITKPKVSLDGVSATHYWSGQWFNPEEFPEFWEKIRDYVGVCFIIGGGFYKISQKEGNSYRIVWKESSEGITYYAKDVSTYFKNGTWIEIPNEKYDAQFTPKSYEIQKLKSKHGRISNMFNKDKGVGWSSDDKPHYSIPEDLVSKGEHSVYSVKRLSDSEVFSIGDKIGADIFKNNVIEKFDIQNGNIYVITSSGTTPLHLIYHAKNPLFVTEDGIKMYENDKFYYVDSYFELGRGVVTNKFSKISNYTHFSTKEKAQEYIDMNKPQYSKQQLYNAGKEGGWAKWEVTNLINVIK